VIQGQTRFIYYKNARKNKLATQAFSRAITIDYEQKTPPNFRYFYGRATAFEENGQLREAAGDYKLSCFLSGKMGCDKTGLSLKP